MTEPGEIRAAAPPADGELPELLLPAELRARVIALASEALGRMPTEHLPAPLKRVASFAPARRGKLAGTQIATVLESDDEFRQHLATHVRSLEPEVATALEQETLPAAAAPEDLGAVAYILRPAGWTEIVRAAASQLSLVRGGVSAGQQQDQAERLRRQLSAATEQLKAAQARAKEETARLKAENADLRKKLGDTRTRLRDAEEAAAQASARAVEQVQDQTAALTQAQSEARRLRGRAEELETQLAALRRTERQERDVGSLRARLLLDTLLETAQGLRRELALPPAGDSPADLVEAHVAELGNRTPSGHGSLSPEDPGVLDSLLALPRAHMIVDGYNVTKTSWGELSLERQRERLLAGLAPLVARTGAEVTVVFDAADKQERPLVNRPRGVRVLFSPYGVIADDVIRELVDAEPQGRPVVVVSSDQELIGDVRRAGARVSAAGALARLVRRT